MANVSPRIAWRPREVKLITGLTMSAKHGNAYTPALVAGINQLGTLAIDNWHVQNPSGAILKLDHWAAAATAAKAAKAAAKVKTSKPKAAAKPKATAKSKAPAKAKPTKKSAA